MKCRPLNIYLRVDSLAQNRSPVDLLLFLLFQMLSGSRWHSPGVLWKPSTAMLRIFGVKLPLASSLAISVMDSWTLDGTSKLTNGRTRSERLSSTKAELPKWVSWVSWSTIPWAMSRTFFPWQSKYTPPSKVNILCGDASERDLRIWCIPYRVC